MRKKVLWYPEKGIDHRIPKMVSETVDFAHDASNIGMYEEKEFTTRKLLKQYNTGSGAIYGMCKYTSGLAIARAAGLYLDSTLKYTTTYSSYVWMAAWYDSLFVSDGVAWVKMYQGSNAYTIGIAAPDEWAGPATFLTTYADYDSSEAGAWTRDGTSPLTKGTLVDATATFTSTVAKGDHVQLYDAITDPTLWVLATVDTVDNDTTLTLLMDSDCTAPINDASVDYYISPKRWCTKSEYELIGEVPAQYYKVRFKRSGDNTRSNTTPLVAASGSVVWKEVRPQLGTCVGKVKLTGISSTSTDTNVDYIELFRCDTSLDDTDMFRLIATLAAGTTSFLDGVETTDDLEVLDDDNKYPCPHVLSNLTVYASRLWGTYQNQVYYSEPYSTTSRFEYFGVAGLNYFEFPDTVQALVDLGRVLLVFLERETWLLEGLTPSTMNQRRMNEDIGTYGNLSAARYGGNVYTVSADMRFWVISGAAWQELPQVSSVLPTSPSYVQLTGSDGALWISTGSQVVKFDLTDRNVWVYSMSGYMASGSHTTYLGSGTTVYEVDKAGGSEATPASYIESPEIYIGSDNGFRGKLNRILFRANCASGTITIYVDDAVWKTVSFSTSGEETVVKHFWPVQGYYAKVRISSSVSLTISGPIILNPW